jgi:thiol-disulfide isomerase/thioredoxin
MKKYCLIFIVCLGLFASCSFVSSQKKGPSDGNYNGSKVLSEYPLLSTAMIQTPIKLIDEKSTKLEDYKGKVLLINLWATWCGPCRMEMPHLVEMQEKHGEKGFQVLGLDVDPEPEDKMKAFAQQMKLNYELGWLDSDLRQGFAKMYPLGSIPTSFLISRDGRFRGVFSGAGAKTINSMKEQVEKALAE